MDIVLFLCTGNYYRSRFAEEYFNYLATKSNLVWRADSRGLRQKMSTLHNVGPISVDVVKMLRSLDIKPLTTDRWPLSVSVRDFQSATKTIAMCEREHRPMMAELFPMYENSIEYWDVEDAPRLSVEDGFDAIQNYVDALVDRLVVVPEIA